MKTAVHIFVALAAFAVGGWLAARGPARVTLPTTSMGSGSANVTAPGTKTHGPIPGNIPPAEEQFSHLLSISQEGGGELKRRAELAEALEEVGPEAIAALVARARKLPQRYGHQLLIAALDRWFDLDPAAARHWVQTAGDRTDGWQIWAAKDPDGVLTFAVGGGKTSAGNQRLIMTALRTIDGEDYAARTRRLAGLPAGPERDKALKQQVSEFARRDASSALAFLATLPLGQLRDDLLPQVLAEVARSDPRRALAFLDDQPDGPRKQDALQALLLTMVLKDPAESLARVETLLPSLHAGLTGNMFINRFSNALAQKDLATSRAWVESLPTEMGQDPLIAVGREWAKTEPMAALQWAIARGVDVTRGLHEFGNSGWSGAILKEAMLTHPEETAQWVRNFPPGTERDRLIERAFQERIYNVQPAQLFNSPTEILFDLFAELPPDAQPRAARDLAAKRAARADFTDLPAWAAQFPAGSAQDAAIAGAVQKVADSNSARAEEMIESLVDPHQHDAAASGLASALSGRDPSSAATRALEIRDPTMRFDTLDRVLPQWLRANASAARAWLVAAAIPSDWRTMWETEAGR